MEDLSRVGSSSLVSFAFTMAFIVLYIKNYMCKQYYYIGSSEGNSVRYLTAADADGSIRTVDPFTS
jgi:hypothetical protein